ncbi:MAG: hypothetical protein B7Z73_01875 [Planctomycetia bacterium 21-64-5]|nr:MAG: hypothetical protein B7Z73_01875 [Planctomycetia bacterium 21-64-5]
MAVSVGGLVPIAPGPSLIAPTDRATVWASGEMRVLWDTDMGLVVCPTAGPTDAPPKVFRVSSPIGYKIVEGHSIKAGGKPLIPDPNPSDSNLTLIKKRLTLTTPPVGPDACTKVYRYDFWYKYVCSSVTVGAGSDGLCMGSLPWMIDAPGDNVSTAADYSDALIGIDPAGGGGGSTIALTGPDI